jgi:hypothetical protein
VSRQLHDLDIAEPDWDGDIDLSQFEALDEPEQMRVLIRVLCGLVALDEEEWFAAWDEPSQPVSQPLSTSRVLPLHGHGRADRKRVLRSAAEHREWAKRRTLPVLPVQRSA